MAKEFLINSIRQVRIGEHFVVPTVVLYKDKKCMVGFEAIDACDEHSSLKEDFKVEIGQADPSKLAQRRLTDGFERQRTVLGIAQDFIDITIKQALAMVERHGFSKPTHILIAEPLAIAQLKSAQDDWLKNYRASIRKILGMTFEEVDFLPEPFAVFQY